MLTVVPDGCPGDEGRKDRSPSLIDVIVREGARRMLAEALQAEVDAYIAAFAAERGEDGRRLVVRNGYHQPREVLTSCYRHRYLAILRQRSVTTDRQRSMGNTVTRTNPGRCLLCGVSTAAALQTLRN